MACASGQLNEHEQILSSSELELLALVRATRHFRSHLRGRQFVARSDHRSLSKEILRHQLPVNEMVSQISGVRFPPRIVYPACRRPKSTHRDPGKRPLESGKHG
ncbi:hypothetical protein L798_09238 [Zootermopsis nevadensis]|uniref:Reverse transcriptase RNase H-like domain-containing protein n=1 Tax=Zootermopsis nevadensis TaxID=136037 RepID=A0A067RDU2_ZOONE|nr:hypothetical protein L798_09238 [Zootermopsis nevadensis]